MRFRNSLALVDKINQCCFHFIRAQLRCTVSSLVLDVHIASLLNQEAGHCHVGRDTAPPQQTKEVILYL